MTQPIDIPLDPLTKEDELLQVYSAIMEAVGPAHNAATILALVKSSNRLFAHVQLNRVADAFWNDASFSVARRLRDRAEEISDVR